MDCVRVNSASAAFCGNDFAGVPSVPCVPCISFFQGQRRLILKAVKDEGPHGTLGTAAGTRRLHAVTRMRYPLVIVLIFLAIARPITADSQPAGDGLIRATSQTNGSFGEVWDLTIERDNSAVVRSVSWGRDGESVTRRFSLPPAQRQAILRAAEEAKFTELPNRLGPPFVQLDGPENWLEFETPGRTYSVRLDDPKSARGSEVARFRRVWKAVVELSPIKPPLR